MKLVLISDTHSKHDYVEIPECDILVHAGDLTNIGKPSETDLALAWLDDQDAKHIVCIAGNHDFFFENYPDSAKELLGNYRIHYLQDSGIELEGVKFWGSPYTPKFYDWAFMYDRVALPRWNIIPDDTDVLITHGPPVGYLDQSMPEHFDSEHLGCYDLRGRVRHIHPKIHVFGHIHGGYGHREDNGTHYYNASIVDEAYAVSNEPHVVEL